MPCPICDVPITPATGARTIRMWAPLGHSNEKVRRVLLEHGVDPTAASDELGMRFEADAKTVRSVLDAVWARLTPPERRATKVLDVATDEAGARIDIRSVKTLDELVALNQASWLLKALEADRLPVTFGRIAFADELSETFAYQALVTAADDDGHAVSLPDVLNTAKRAGILFPVDRACRVTAIRRSRSLARQHPVFIPFSPSSIYDPAYCLATTVAAAREQETPLDSIVFTILAPESDDDSGHLQGIIEYYRSHGFKVAMAGLGAGFTAFDLLPKLRPDTIFLDPGLSEQVLADPVYAVIARKLLQIAHRLDIETVFDGVEHEAQAQWAYENGANYVSGRFVADGQAHGNEAA